MTGNEIVQPGPEIFNFVGSDGKDLRAMVMEINQMYSEYSVQRNSQQPLMDELKRLRNDVETRGVARDTMAAVESFSDIPLQSAYPLTSYTQRRSWTNAKVAIEEIDARQAGLLAVLGAAAVGILYKVVKWILGLFGKSKDMNVQAATNAQKTDTAATVADTVSQKYPDVGRTADAALKTNEKYQSAKQKLDDGSYSKLIQNLIAPTGYAVSLRELLNGLPKFVHGVESLVKAVESLEEGGRRVVKHNDQEVADVMPSAVAEMLSRWSDIGEVYPELDSFLRNVQMPAGKGLGSYSKALGEFRQRCMAEGDEKLNLPEDTKGYTTINREICRLIGNGSGQLAAFRLPDNIEGLLKTLEREVERLANKLSRLRTSAQSEHLEIVQQVHAAMDYVREYTKVLSNIVSLAPWLLGRLTNFQNVLRQIMLARMEEVGRAAKDAGHDITPERQAASAEEERILRQMNS